MILISCLRTKFVSTLFREGFDCIIGNKTKFTKDLCNNDAVKQHSTLYIMTPHNQWNFSVLQKENDTQNSQLLQIDIVFIKDTANGGQTTSVGNKSTNKDSN